MANKIVYFSPYIEISKRDDGFYVRSFKTGLSYEDFCKIVSSNKEIQITNFAAIKEALVLAPRDAQKFGIVRQRVKVEVASDELKAFITLNVDESEMGSPSLIKEIITELNKMGVVFGIKKDALLNLYLHKPILIAEAQLPVHGHDSINNVYQMKEVKPEIKEDGNVDHYELNLINMVHKGDWLGEKIYATQGMDGKTVKGTILKSIPGHNYPIPYDKKTVKEVDEGNKSSLYALQTGAVFFEGDQIGVSNYLEIKDNVGVKTGNVDFDGYLTVKGTIEDNFTVSTTKDIEILSEYGVGSVKEIVSNEGSIYIKGGINGKGKTVIRCKKNLYLKYVADTDIICDGSVHVGFYCLNSNITAKEVVLDSMKGQIMGGCINAEIRVVASILGTAREKKTVISVKGFDRNALMASVEENSQRVISLKNEINVIKQEMAVQSERNEYDKLVEKLNGLRTEMQECEDRRKNFTGYLRAKGEGEITFLKKAFPNTLLEIRKIQMEIQEPRLRSCFYYSEGAIKEI